MMLMLTAAQDVREGRCWNCGGRIVMLPYCQERQECRALYFQLSDEQREPLRQAMIQYRECLWRRWAMTTLIMLAVGVAGVAVAIWIGLQL